MYIKDYALTEEALAYMGLYEPFYELYCSYKDILLSAQKELNSKKENAVRTDEITKLANNNSRQLFNDFFNQYSYLFVDEQYIFHANTVFMRRMNLYDISNVKPLTLEISFISFDRFLVRLEWSVAYLIRNKKEKEVSHSFNEETILTNLNNRIQRLQNGGKLYQCVDYDSTTSVTDICNEITIYHDLKNISCNQKKHEIVSSFCYCRIVDDKIVRLPAHFCSTCNKYFIGIESIKLYEKLYGKLIVLKNDENEHFFFSNFGESELYQTGYDAKENGMTDMERREHLKFLLETEKMKPFEIIRDLEGAIKLHKYKYQDRFAVEKWKKDLEYVNKWIENKVNMLL